MERNFGMASPEGYRKALRLFRLAERLRIPVLTFIDTQGANRGVGAEERGQAEAIAHNLRNLRRAGDTLERAVAKHLSELEAQSIATVLARRYEKYRHLGRYIE